MKLKHVLLITLIILILDQWLKIYIKTHYHYGQELNVIGNWFKLHFIENEGMAFGMKFGGGYGKLLLTLFRLVAVIWGVYFIQNTLIKGKYHRGLIVCSALILAGAIGNLIDSIFYGMIFTDSSFHLARFTSWGTGYGTLFHGKVVDMLYFPIVEGTYPAWVPRLGGQPFLFFSPIFNIADAAISTGVIAIFVFQTKFLKKQDSTPEPTHAESAVSNEAQA